MKNIIKLMKVLFLSIIFIITASIIAYSCEIDLNVVGDKQNSYKVGDEVIIKVTVLLTHRNCPEGIDKTKFEGKNLDIIGGTKWVEKSAGTYERKLKVKIKDYGNGKAVLNATRTCDKEGGFGSISLKVSK